MNTPFPVGCVAAKSERTKATGKHPARRVPTRGHSQTPPVTLRSLLERVERMERAMAAQDGCAVTLGHLSGDAGAILARVCQRLNLTPKQLRHGGRAQPLAEARRMVAAALATEGIPHSGISQAMGWTTPSTVSKALKTHTETLTRPDYAQAWARIQATQP